MSRRNPRDSDLGIIADVADAAESRVDATSTEDRVAALEDRLASMESLLEQAQANAGIGTQLNRYMKGLESEQEFFNEARIGIAALSGAVVIFLLILLYMAVFSSQSPLLKATPATAAAVVLGLVSGIVFVLNGFSKGLFRSTAERHADGFLPPALEHAAETYSKITGAGGKA